MTKHKIIIIISLIICALVLLSCQKKEMDELIDETEVPKIKTERAYTSYDVQGWDTEIIGMDGDTLFYADNNSSTWSYSFNANDLSSGKAIRIDGVFPDAIYMSYYLLDRTSFTTLGSINDINIEPDQGVHPIIPIKTEYTIWIMHQENGTEDIANKLLIPERAGEVAIVLQYYLTNDNEFGFVDVPRITTEDIDSDKSFNNPPSIKTKRDKRIVIERLLRHRARAMFANFNIGDDLLSYRFGSFHGRLGNRDNEYLMMPVVLKEDEVALIRFVPPVAADSIYEEDADVRYWSVGFGDDETRMLITLYRDDLVVSDAGFVYIAIADGDMTDVFSKESGWNYVDWPSDKKLVLVYRNVLTSLNAPFNIEDVEIVNYTKDVDEQSADKVIGDFAPIGVRIKKSEAEEWAKHYEYGE